MRTDGDANIAQYPQTKFFQACRGVFEGGGCRGAGHVGAYEAAIQCGVNFSEIAGTSAGSIIAVLIGAGASPEFLREKCAYLKFSELLSEPKKRISTFWLSGLVRPLFSGQNKLLWKILLNGAAYSSENLENWLDDLLAELLPHAQRPIKFSDLILPTYVVATDLSGMRPKIWSTKDTPDAKVAMAVRSSCSIPLFFEPVESGNDFFVDGGMLSNLPSFVFADHRSDTALGGRILAFRLIEDEKLKTEWTINWLARRLIDTVISGATTLQSEFQGNVSSIEISTGKVSGTNFNISKKEVGILLDSGRAAVMDFIRDEHLKLSDSLGLDIIRYSEDELFDDLVREMMTPGKRLIVSCVDTIWFWALFPSIAHWMFNGAEVDILIKPESCDAREKQRLDILRQMGAKIVETSKIPLNCFLLSRNDERHNGLFVRDIDTSEHSPEGVVYVGTKHRIMISIILKDLDELLGSDNRKRPMLTLEKGDSDKVISALKKGVHQYSGLNVKIEMQEVSLKQTMNSSVKMIVRRVRSFKYRQIAHLSELYDIYDIPFGMPADIKADGHYVSTVTPPVFEQWGSDLVAIEGNTRVYYSNRVGVESIQGLVVSGVVAPLPGRPVDLQEVLLSTYHLPSNERIGGFLYDNFRSIERAARPINQ